MKQVSIFAVLVFCTFVAVSAKASVFWEWEFAESELYVQVGDPIDVNVLIRNDANSDNKLVTFMLNWDNSWGFFSDDPNQFIVINHIVEIDPGDEVEVLLANIYPGISAGDYSGTYALNPLMYGYEYQFPPPFFPMDDARFAVSPLTVYVSPVPVPSAFFLFGSGILTFFGVRKYA